MRAHDSAVVVDTGASTTKEERAVRVHENWLDGLFAGLRWEKGTALVRHNRFLVRRHGVDNKIGECTYLLNTFMLQGDERVDAVPREASDQEWYVKCLSGGSGDQTLTDSDLWELEFDGSSGLLLSTPAADDRVKLDFECERSHCDARLVHTVFTPMLGVDDDERKTVDGVASVFQFEASCEDARTEVTFVHRSRKAANNRDGNAVLETLACEEASILRAEGEPSDRDWRMASSFNQEPLLSESGVDGRDCSDAPMVHVTINNHNADLSLGSGPLNVHVCEDADQSSETEFRKLADALEAVAFGGTITLCEGNHTVSGCLAIDRPVSIQPDELCNSRPAIRCDPPAGCCCLFDLTPEAAGSTIHRLDFSGAQGSAVVARARGATIRQSTFDGNRNAIRVMDSRKVSIAANDIRNSVGGVVVVPKRSGPRADEDANTCLAERGDCMAAGGTDCMDRYVECVEAEKKLGREDDKDDKGDDGTVAVLPPSSGGAVGGPDRRSLHAAKRMRPHKRADAEATKTCDDVYGDCFDLVPGRTFTDLFLEHITYTVKLLIARADPEWSDVSVNDTISKLLKNIDEWSDRIEAIKPDFWLGEKWAEIFTEHTLQANDLITAVHFPEASDKTQDEAVAALSVNMQRVIKFWKYWPDNPTVLSGQVEFHWTRHLTCTNNYIEVFETEGSGKAFKDAVNECKEFGRQWGDFLDTEVIVPKCRDKLEACLRALPCGNVYDDCFDAVGDRDFKNLFHVHITYTVNLLLADSGNAGKDDPTSEESVKRLLENIDMWRDRIDNIFVSTVLGDPWVEIFTEHTLLARDLITSVHNPRQTEKTVDEAIEDLEENQERVVAYWPALPSKPPLESARIDQHWMHHLDCTANYILVLKKKGVCPEFQNAVDECLFFGDLFGDHLDSDLRVPRCDQAVADCLSGEKPGKSQVEHMEVWDNIFARVHVGVSHELLDDNSRCPASSREVGARETDRCYDGRVRVVGFDIGGNVFDGYEAAVLIRGVTAIQRPFEVAQNKFNKVWSERGDGKNFLTGIYPTVFASRETRSIVLAGANNAWVRDNVLHETTYLWGDQSTWRNNDYREGADLQLSENDPYALEECRNTHTPRDVEVRANVFCSEGSSIVHTGESFERLSGGRSRVVLAENKFTSTRAVAVLDPVCCDPRNTQRFDIEPNNMDCDGKPLDLSTGISDGTGFDPDPDTDPDDSVPPPGPTPSSNSNPNNNDDDDEHRTTAIVFGVLFGATFIALVVVAILLAVRTRRLGAASSATSTSESQWLGSQSSTRSSDYASSSPAPLGTIPAAGSTLNRRGGGHQSAKLQKMFYGGNETNT